MASKLERAYRFHGHESPGTTLGVIMADYALELFRENITCDDKKDMKAFVETRKCIADSVQIATGRTAGGGLTVVDYGKYAVTLYNATSGEGVRVFVDPEKTREYKNIDDWFLRRKPKKDLPKEIVIKEILKAGRNILSHESVKIKVLGKKHLPIKICVKCKEAFPSEGDELCEGCRNPYYEKKWNA
jgi:formylmethanofuran dehydrogenase subunit E